MVGLFEDDCRSLIFLVDAACCSTSANVSKGKGAPFLRQVAKEHSSMVLSVMERLLAHSQQLATGGVLWSFRIFDSLAPDSPVLTPSFSFSHPSLPNIDECRKMVLKQFNLSCENIRSPTCSSQSVAATIIDGIAAVSKQIGTPDSFLVDSTDTDCTPMKRKRNINKVANRPLVVLLAKAPHGSAEFDTFLNTQRKSAFVKKECQATHESDEEIVSRLNLNESFNRAIEDLSKHNAQLLWIDSYSRRVQDTSTISSQFSSVFKSWFLRKSGVNAFVDMHSLLLDRNILPFSSIARSTLLQAPLPMVNLIPESENTSLKWIYVDFVLPSRLSNGPLQSCNERVLRLEITESLLFDPANRPEGHSKYWAVCVGLLKHPKSDAELSALGAYESTPGLARPARHADSEEGASDSEKWVGVFAGIMTAMAHTGHSLVATIYCNNNSSAQSQPIQTVILQPLTPLSAVIRRTNLPLPESAENRQLTEGMQIDQNVLRKRVFAGLCDIADSRIDSVGPPCGSSQSSRFFEAHLSTIDSRNEDCDPKPARDSKTLADNLCRFARAANPRLISENLEALQNASSLNDSAKLAVGLDEATEELGGELCSLSAGDLELGDKLLAGLESRLDIEQPTEKIPTVESSAACPREPCSTSENPNSTISVVPVLPTSPLETFKASEDRKESVASVVRVEEDDADISGKSPELEPGLTPVGRGGTKNESPGLFSCEFDRIDELMGEVKDIELAVLVERCEAVLRAIGNLVDSGITRGVPMSDDENFNKRIMKLKKIQKMSDSTEKSQGDGGKKGSSCIFSLCLRLFEQVILHIFNQMPRMPTLDELDGKVEKKMSKRLNRPSKILNMVLALAESQGRFLKDSKTYHSLFDSFFSLVISRFTMKKNRPLFVRIGMHLATEFEKPVVSEDDCDTISRYQKKAGESTPSEAVFEVLPPLPKRRRARDDRKESRDRKRPRTKDHKQVLAKATISRSIPTGESRRDGIRSLVHEKSIQRPLLAKSKSGRNKERKDEDDVLTRWNRGRKLRYSSPSKGLNPALKPTTAPIAFSGSEFYSKKETNTTTKAIDNPILVPGTPESEEGSEEGSEE